MTILHSSGIRPVTAGLLHADQMQKTQEIRNSIFFAVQHLFGKFKKLSCEADKTGSMLVLGLQSMQC